jgi:hypothetical protein
MNNNPYDKMIEELRQKQQDLRTERDYFEKFYMYTIADNAALLGFRIARKLDRWLTVRFRMPDYVDDANWYNSSTTNKYDIKRKLLQLINRINEINKQLSTINQQIEHLGKLSKEFNAFISVTGDNTEAVMNLIERAVGDNKIILKVK